jgi:hypothetical protein
MSVHPDAGLDDDEDDDDEDSFLWLGRAQYVLSRIISFVSLITQHRAPRASQQASYISSFLREDTPARALLPELSNKTQDQNGEAHVTP